MEQFRYKLLDHERGAIRLVRLLSGTNKPIRLESIHSNLDEESCIPYEAVSYMRGSTNEGWTVEVDGQQLTITRNLSLALLSLRHANEDRILWIDSICINKFDIEERRKQEQQMYTIYRRAKKVIVWSSKSTPKTDLVILSMQRLEKEAQKHWYKNRKSSDRLWLKLWSAVGNGGKDFIIQQKGIENSLSQSWSKREWTLQEGANAQSAKVADDLKTVSEPIPQVTKVVIPVNQDLTTVLMRFEVSRASKLSVKMYALLDLQSDKHTRAHVLDNSKSSVEVVQDTVAAALGFDMGWRSFCSLPEWELSDLYKNSLLLKEKVMRWAIEEGQLATLKSIMLGQRINVVGDSFGHGSLPWKPILHQVTAIANSLFEIGADVNLHHEKSCNALVAVVRNGHRQIEKLLLERFTEVERSGDDRITTRKVLPWLVAAPRPLSLDEIDAALSAELDKPGASIRPYGRDVEELLSFCGPLVRLVPHEKAEQQQVSLAHFSVKDYLHTERRELLSGSGDNSDLLDGKGLMMKALLEAKSPLNATDDWIQQQKFEEDDVQSLFPEDGDAAFPTSMLLPSWASARRTMVGIFTNSSVLSPLYSKALQLMTEKRFISNFEYLLKAFHGSLVASDDSNVARQLAKFLESSQRRSRIARMVVARHVALQSPWDEGNLANLRDQEKQAYTNMEDWLDRTVVSPTIINTPANRSGDTDKEFKSGNDSNSELNREENISHFAQYPRLYLVVQKLVEGRPFKDMLTGFKELLLPPGLLKELLPIPRDNITYRTTEETGLLSTVQGFLEEITALEWDWWPLSPRMRPLKPSETRVHWKCFCGANRWRELKLEQQEILIEVLKEPPADHHPRPLCALLQDTKNTSCTKTSGPSRNPRVRSKFCTVFENGLIFMATALGCWYGDIKVGWFWCFFTIACFVWVIVVFQNPTSRPNQKATPGAHRSATSSGAVPSLGAQAMQSQPGNSATSQVGGNLPIQPTSASSPTTQGSLVNNSVYNKQLWVNFGVDGSGIPTELDQLGGLDLVSDSTFLRNLRKRHLEIRGRLRHYLSIRIISYWEFLRFKRLQLHPPQTIDVKADLPTSSDYEYDPRPPNATLDNPGITKHEFEVYVRLCLEPCWLPSLLIPHKCRTVKDSAVDIIDRVPKYKKFLEQHAQGDEHIWGIRARYVVSSVRVIAFHVAILCISFGVWIWWQWKHPDDLQGAAVALGTAFLLVSTFWSATGVLKDLR